MTKSWLRKIVKTVTRLVANYLQPRLQPARFVRADREKPAFDMALDVYRNLTRIRKGSALASFDSIPRFIPSLLKETCALILADREREREDRISGRERRFSTARGHVSLSPRPFLLSVCSFDRARSSASLSPRRPTPLAPFLPLPLLPPALSIFLALLLRDLLSSSSFDGDEWRRASSSH